VKISMREQNETFRRSIAGCRVSPQTLSANFGRYAFCAAIIDERRKTDRPEGTGTCDINQESSTLLASVSKHKDPRALHRPACVCRRSQALNVPIFDACVACLRGFTLDLVGRYDKNAQSPVVMNGQQVPLARRRVSYFADGVPRSCQPRPVLSTYRTAPQGL
jgi:hypothetical protein